MPPRLLLYGTLLLCLFAPLKWAIQPPYLGLAIATAGAFLVLGRAIYVEDPTAFRSLPKLVVLLAFVGASAISLSSLPTAPSWDGKSVLSAFGYLFLWIMVGRNSYERIRDISHRVTTEGLPARLAAVSQDLEWEILTQEEFEQRCEWVRQEEKYFRELALGMELLTAQWLGTWVIHFALGPTTPGYLWLNFATVFLLSTSVGMVVARATSDSNLD